jgi:hypothetical protein
VHAGHKYERGTQGINMKEDYSSLNLIAKIVVFKGTDPRGLVMLERPSSCMVCLIIKKYYPENILQCSLKIPIAHRKTTL